MRPIDLLDDCRDAGRVVDAVQAHGVQGQALLAVAVAPGVGLGLATGDHVWAVPCDDDVATETVAAIEQKLHPRWVWWSAGTSNAAVHASVHIARCWDIAAVHRLLAGGWTAAG